MLGKIKRVIFTCNREKFVAYLKSLGAEIGENVYFVNPRKTRFDYNRAPFIKIGNEVVICSGVSIIAHDYSWTVLMKAYDEVYPTGGGQIIIGNNVFIGENSTILRNVSIGDNVIIAANAVVTKNCENNSVYAGVPAKKIMSLDEYREKMKESLKDEIHNNIQSIMNRKKRLPKQEEMMSFSFLFLPRNEESIQLVSKQSWIGCDKSKMVSLFKTSTPLYSSFEDFVENNK